MNELEELKELDISLQEGAHILSQKKVNKVERLKVNIKGGGSFNGYPIVAQHVTIKIEGRGRCEVGTLISRFFEICLLSCALYPYES